MRVQRATSSVKWYWHEYFMKLSREMESAPPEYSRNCSETVSYNTRMAFGAREEKAVAITTTIPITDATSTTTTTTTAAAAATT
jgi:hypothetical protein